MGKVEEITATYVVVKLWDWRRLILPLGYFIEKPFQNWTREGASLIGTVMIISTTPFPSPRSAARWRRSPPLRRSGTGRWSMWR